MAACNGPDLNVGNAISRQHGMFESRVIYICRLRSISNFTLIGVVVERLLQCLKHGLVAVESITGGTRIHIPSWKGRPVSGAWVIWLILDSTH
jgi:hypothetical protein